MSILSKSAFVAAAALAGVALQSMEASAMPIDRGVAATVQSGDGVGLQQAYWHGGPRHHGYHRHYGWHRHHGWHRHRR